MNLFQHICYVQHLMRTHCTVLSTVLFLSTKYIYVTSHDHEVTMCVHSCFPFLAATQSRPPIITSTNQRGRFCFVRRLLTEVATIPQLRQTTSVFINKVISLYLHAFNMRNVVLRYYNKIALAWESMQHSIVIYELSFKTIRPIC